MRRLPLAVLLLCGISVLAFGSDNQKEIERGLREAYLGHFLSLKSPSYSDHLRFRPDGASEDAIKPAPWTTFGLFQVTKLSVKKDRIEIEGDHLVIAWRAEQTPYLLPLVIGKKLKITLESYAPISDTDQTTQMFKRVFDHGNIDRRIAAYWKPDASAIAAFRKPGNTHEEYGVLEGNRKVFGVKAGIVSPPRPMYDPDPPYTDAARKDKLQGITVLRLVVNENGLPEIIEITKNLGDGLDLAALDAISQWRFQPAKMNGTPIAVLISVEVNFRLY